MLWHLQIICTNQTVIKGLIFHWSLLTFLRTMSHEAPTKRLKHKRLFKAPTHQQLVICSYFYSTQMLIIIYIWYSYESISRKKQTPATWTQTMQNKFQEKCDDVPFQQYPFTMCDCCDNPWTTTQRTYLNMSDLSFEKWFSWKYHHLSSSKIYP